MLPRHLQEAGLGFPLAYNFVRFQRKPVATEYQVCFAAIMIGDARRVDIARDN